MNWMKRFLTWFVWLFKPTYYVFPSINAALAQLPRRGGTIRLGPGKYAAGDGIELPDKDVRVIGAGPETVLEVSGTSAMRMDVSGSGGTTHLEDLMIQGANGRAQGMTKAKPRCAQCGRVIRRWAKSALESIKICGRHQSQEGRKA